MNDMQPMRILILEDEVLLAIEAAETLEEIGAEIVGPVHRVEEAMALLDVDRPDAALLDVNIGGSSSVEVARHLQDRNIPFVLATGYGSQCGIAGACALIDKPYSRTELQAAFLSIVANSSPR